MASFIRIVVARLQRAESRNGQNLLSTQVLFNWVITTSLRLDFCNLLWLYQNFTRIKRYVDNNMASKTLYRLWIFDIIEWCDLWSYSKLVHTGCLYVCAACTNKCMARCAYTKNPRHAVWSVSIASLLWVVRVRWLYKMYLLQKTKIQLNSLQK